MFHANRPAIAIVALIVSIASASSLAGSIGPDAIGPTQVTHNLNNLPSLTVTGNATTSLGLDLVTLQTNSDTFRYADIIGDNDEQIGTDTESGWIDLIFDEPVIRFGTLVATTKAWTARVYFFGHDDSELGQINLAGDADEFLFAGWEAEYGWISRVRIVDTAINSKTLFIDDLRIEAGQAALPVPTPTSAGLGAVLLALCVSRRARSQFRSRLNMNPAIPATRQSG